jgi:hypothetical protein
MLISCHSDGRIFQRYDIVDTRDMAEAMRKVAEYDDRKRESRLLRSHTFPEPERRQGVLVATASNNFKIQWFGPVAQLGARMTGSHEVEGSNPSRSTITHSVSTIYNLCSPACKLEKAATVRKPT